MTYILLYRTQDGDTLAHRFSAGDDREAFLKAVSVCLALYHSRAEKARFHLDENPEKEQLIAVAKTGRLVTRIIF